jgi:hypothetical protein
LFRVPYTQEPESPRRPNVPPSVKTAHSEETTPPNLTALRMPVSSPFVEAVLQPRFNTGIVL